MCTYVGMALGSDVKRSVRRAESITNNPCQPPPTGKASSANAMQCSRESTIGFHPASESCFGIANLSSSA